MNEKMNDMILPSLLGIPKVRVQLVSEPRATDISCDASVGLARIAHSEIGRCDREVMLALLLTAQLKLIGVHVVSMGTLTDTAFTVREIFKAGILANAYCLALAHNHLSGGAGPSATDVEATDDLVKAGDMLGIPVVDHVIVCPDGKWSAYAEGWRVKQLD